MSSGAVPRAVQKSAERASALAEEGGGGGLGGAAGRRKEQLLFRRMLGGGNGGVRVCDRKGKEGVLPSCCVGNEIVDWLVADLHVSRREAVAVAQGLLDKGLLAPAEEGGGGSEPPVFEDKFTFYRKTTRGEAISSTKGSSRGERSLRRSGVDDGAGGAGAAGARSPLSLSPRMGRGAPSSEEDASALTYLVSALAAPPPKATGSKGVTGTGLLRKSPINKARADSGTQTPTMSTISARHSSVAPRPVFLDTSSGGIGPVGPAGGGGGGGGGPTPGTSPEATIMDLESPAVEGLLATPPRRPYGSMAVRTASEWRKSSVQHSMGGGGGGLSAASRTHGDLLQMPGKDAMEGWLHKQSARDPLVWKRRYLVLKGGKTVYSRVEKGADAEIPMDVVGSVRMAPEVHPFAFCIDAVTRSFILRADSKDELNAWVFAYHKAALLVLDLLAAPGHIPRESRLRLQKWWKSRSAETAGVHHHHHQEEPACPVETSMEMGENGVVAGAAWSMGRRPTMEDTHLLQVDLREELEDAEGTMALFGVFDGHGGSFTANLARDGLLSALADQWSAQAKTGEINDEAALVGAFLELDKKIIKACMDRGDRSGACAAVALLRDDNLLVAHCGDCRIVFCSEEGGADAALHVQALTLDHKPDREDEKARVEAAGGFVTLAREPDLAALHRKTPAQLAALQQQVSSGKTTLIAHCGTITIARVMGSLGVSRSLGDVGFKTMRSSLFPGRTLSQDLVVATPEVARVSLTGSSFAILACDGLWDVLTAEKAGSIANGVLKSGKTPRDAAAALVDRAMKRGSLDNVSCLVVVLPSDHDQGPALFHT